MSKKEEKKKNNKPKLSSKENKRRLKELEKQAKLNEDNYEMVRLFKILLGVIGALAIFGLIFAYFHGDIFKKKEKVQEEIQNIEIMAGTAFTKQSGNYYVLFYDFNGENKELMEKVHSAFGRSNSTMKIFKVNLGSELNKSYKANTSEEVNTSSNKDLKVLDPTLLEITDGQVVKVYSGKEEIVNFEESTIKSDNSSSDILA